VAFSTKKAPRGFQIFLKAGIEDVGANFKSPERERKEEALLQLSHLSDFAGLRRPRMERWRSIRFAFIMATLHQTVSAMNRTKGVHLREEGPPLLFGRLAGCVGF
jgi:hypothetical protein